MQTSNQDQNTLARRIARVVTLQPPATGFMGEGHTAVLVVDSARFQEQDPFILLADDRMELPEGALAGEAHPHAGFETVTFLLEGSLHDADEGTLEAGDVQWMTAGEGVIHNEHVVPQGKSRLLQLWLTLPSANRWSAPRFETIAKASAPVRQEAGVTVRVYSGQSGAAVAPTHNYVPVTMLDVELEAGASFEQELPASYNAFAYVLRGDAVLGESREAVREGQVAWLDRSDAERGNASVFRIEGGAAGARVVLYAGEPQGAPLVTHGPFVGESRSDIMRASRDYIAGRFVRMSDLARSHARSAT